MLIFGSVPVQELRAEIGKIARVSTVHSFAYQNTISQYGLRKDIAGKLNYRDIPKHIRKPFGIDSITLEHIEAFCLSPHLTIEAYFQDQSEVSGTPVRFAVQKLARELLNAMSRGQMRITHSFYLKLFHVKVMSGEIKLPAVDLLLVDEVQDSSSITLDIVSKVPAKQLVLVGDTSQMIFDFLKLENGFLRYPNAHVLTLSKSFRVDQSFAPAIQKFIRLHLQPEDTNFHGMDYGTHPTPLTTAYLTRTNAALIGRMIELNKCGTPYKLAHKAKLKQMFKWPLALIYATPQHKQQDSELTHLQADIDAWGKLPLKTRESISKLKYILKQNPDDANIKSAIKLISKFGSDDIIAAYNQAESHRTSICNYTLSTGYMCKGKLNAPTESNLCKQTHLIAGTSR